MWMVHLWHWNHFVGALETEWYPCLLRKIHKRYMVQKTDLSNGSTVIEAWVGRDITTPTYSAISRPFISRRVPSLSNTINTHLSFLTTIYFMKYSMHITQSSPVVHHESLWCHRAFLQCSNYCRSSVGLWRAAQLNSHSHLQLYSWWPGASLWGGHNCEHFHTFLCYIIDRFELLLLQIFQVINNCVYLNFN
jgi:hypothetical protein